MARDPYQPPDLASILQTLAQYAPAQPQTLHVGTQNVSSTRPEELEEQEEDEYQPPDLIASLQLPPRTPQPPAPTSSQTPTATQNAPKPPPVDPATITDWSAALRCVTRTVGRSEGVMERIRKMMQVQHDHEKQWWDGRIALLEKQAGRVEGKKRLDAVLLSVGGIVTTNTTVSTPEEDLAELTRYDRKVHRAAREMVESMSKELKNLGVPFFGMSDALVRKPNGSGPIEQDKLLDKDELKQLQRKMLQFLEDLCRE